MRKIEAQMIQAIREALNNAAADGQIMKAGNTEVRQVHHGVAHTMGYYRELEVRLHGSLIGVVEPDLMRLRLDDCGYKTATTKSRLNALLSAFVPGQGLHQTKGDWFCGTDEWQGSDEWSMRLSPDNYVLQQAQRLAA
jgi:hypothetical protein